MKYLNYIKESDRYMHSLFICMDNAWSAEKMYDWDNLGDDNQAWAEGPYITAGANCSQIDRSRPYCLHVSAASSMLVGYQIGPQPKFEKNGGVAFGHVRERIKANVIIPTVSICMQFYLLEAFDIESFTKWVAEKGIDLDSKTAKRYDRQPVRSRMEILNALCQLDVSDKCINAYESVSNFRNKLTHEPQFFCGAPEVAIDVYIVCQAISYNLHRVLHDNCDDDKVSHRMAIWNERLSHFDEVMDFE